MTARSLPTVALLTVAVGAVPHRLSPQTEPTPLDRIVVTRQAITVGGRALRYTARAGPLPIRDNETGEPRARIFFVSYTLDRAPGNGPRPLLFYWNGGPGSSASQPHLLGFGPRIAKMDDDFATAGPISETTMVDNDATWLAAADLVFVDPGGTGYSRATKREYAEGLYQVRGDAESIAEFIRVWQIRFDAQDAPLYIGGESYGTTRAANVAEVLVRRRIPLAGAVLAALATPIAARDPLVRAALQLPSYTAAAHYWKKLAPDLQRDRAGALAEAERWAGTEYIHSLGRRDSLSESERREVMDRVARYSGLDRSLIDPGTLVVTDFEFIHHLLRDQGRRLSLYDTRRWSTWTGPLSTDIDPFTEAGLVPQLGHMNGTSVLLNRYFRKTLAYRSDLPYQGPFGGAYPTADKPRNVWAVAQLSPGLGRRFTVRSYEGGHEAYLSRGSRIALRRDFAAFVGGGSKLF